MSTDTTTKTEIGSYFISNYPPFSQWSRDQIPAAFEALDGEPDASVPLGMYIHIPFCRKRCKFCYFRVYTQQNAETIRNYVDTLDREVQLLKDRPGVAGRNLRFVYFGGGTPSYLSARQLKLLRDRLSASVSWDDAEEVTFECEPGTLSLEKVQTLKEIGVTRVSLGVENFNDKILEENGRAHLSPEILRAYDWIRQVGFPQVNIDLIAGMVGETDENWRACVEKAIELEPDNVTVYQMELPWNTTYSKQMLEQGIEAPVADWPTKRRWASEAIDRLLAAGYEISSGNELVGNLETDHFVYRDNLFRGSDILAVGVSSFGHLQGVHYQNLDRIEDYMASVHAGELPINRALVPSDHQRLIREWVLQMKEGRVPVAPFREKFGVDPLVAFAEPLANQQKAGHLVVEDDVVQLTRKGLLQADSLLTEYFEEEHREVRYT
ncbi:MAG: coproporphyrinogen-III oxidase family protein [Maioricimonas sp. JB049]